MALTLRGRSSVFYRIIMITYFFDSQNRIYRNPFGAVTAGTFVKLRIDAYDDCPSDASLIRTAEIKWSFYDTLGNVSENSTPLSVVFKDNVDTEYGPRLKYIFEGELKSDAPGVVFFRFAFKSIEGDTCYGNNADLFGGIGENGSEEYYQITVTERNLKVPEWWKKGIIYQIFPDRFCRGIDATVEDKPNAFYYGTWDDLPFYVRKEGSTEIARWDFHRGNLSGVNGKIPYIEAIGANIIYLNPIFKARSNHRYDTCDYMHVDGLLGGDSAFELLSYICGKEGIKLMLDGVFSHTGADSIYFDREETRGTGAYNNPKSRYRSWYNFSPETDDEYECWWGVKDLPNVNELDPDYLDYIVRNDDSVIRHWIKKGASGWRLDVADELPDKFIAELRKAADEAGSECGRETVILGEVWEDASNKVSYEKLRSYFTSRELHTVTNYPFRKNLLAFFDGEIDASYFARRILSLKENYPKHNFYSLVNMTGTHDVPRLMTEMMKITCGNRYDARSLVKAYAAVMFTFPGVPLVYYGDETCLEGDVDPDNRRTFPWGHEDVNMITHFANLAILRKNNPALISGEIRFLNAGPDTLCYSRFDDNTEFLVLASNVSVDACVSGLTPGLTYVPADFDTAENNANAAEKFVVSADGTLLVSSDAKYIILKRI